MVAQEHNLYIPTDNNTGKLTGTRIHTPFLFTKEIASSSPYLYKAVTTGQTLKSAEFKWYRINDAGQEVEYFNTKLENVKVVKVNPLMHDIKNLSLIHISASMVPRKCPCSGMSYHCRQASSSTPRPFTASSSSAHWAVRIC